MEIEVFGLHLNNCSHTKCPQKNTIYLINNELHFYRTFRDTSKAVAIRYNKSYLCVCVYIYKLLLFL